MNIAAKATFVLSQRHLLGSEGASREEILGLLYLAENVVELNRRIDKSNGLAARAPADQPVPQF